MPKINPLKMRHYKNNPNLKTCGIKIQFTPEQVAERIKCSQDPIYFMENYVKIVHIDKGLIPFEMYDFQKELVKSYIDNRFTIAKLPRQTGKCLQLNSNVTLRYMKKYIITLEIGKLYEICKENKFDELLSLSKTICEEHSKQLLFTGV